jgi:outer membrane protein OmpA-like peptidoglycan-associated protein
MRYLYTTVWMLLVLTSNDFYAQTSKQQCHNHVIGKVVDKMKEQNLGNSTIFIEKPSGEIKEIKADNNGNFSFDLPCDNGRYVVSTVIMNYTKSSKLVFTSKNKNKNHNIVLDLYPSKEFVKINEKDRIIVNSIIFLPNEKRINPEAAKELMTVYDIMNKYKDLNLEIGFHTDSRGGKDFMLKLTQQRADACADFLIKKGIDSSRITAKGYGSTQLLNECTKKVKCSEEKHAMNRRSEFIVY